MKRKSTTFPPFDFLVLSWRLLIQYLCPMDGAAMTAIYMGNLALFASDHISLSVRTTAKRTRFPTMLPMSPMWYHNMWKIISKKQKWTIFLEWERDTYFSFGILLVNIFLLLESFARNLWHRNLRELMLQWGMEINIFYFATLPHASFSLLRSTIVENIFIVHNDFQSLLSELFWNAQTNDLLWE